jgi:pre-60S factor REI1
LVASTAKVQLVPVETKKKSNVPPEGADVTPPPPRTDAAEMTDEEFVECRLKTEAPLATTDCLFCARPCLSVEKYPPPCTRADPPPSVLRHMRARHGFLLPCAERVDDVEGLLEYLGRKLTIGAVCLSCDRTFGSVAAARGHMGDVGHCGVRADGSDEGVLQFYDAEFGAEARGEGGGEDWEDEGEWEDVEGGEGEDEAKGRGRNVHPAETRRLAS